VRALGVVEDEPVGQLLVEGVQVGKEQVFVVIDEGLLHGSMEALDVGVHFGCLRVGVPALDALCFERFGEIGLEFGAVVGEHPLGRLGEQRQGQVECCSRVAGVLGGRGPGEGEVRRRIDEGDDIASQTVTDALHGVASEHLQGRQVRAFGLSWLGEAPEGPVAAFGIDSCWRMAHFVRGAGNDATNRGDAGQGDAVLLTPRT